MQYSLCDAGSRLPHKQPMKSGLLRRRHISCLHMCHSRLTLAFGLCDSVLHSVRHPYAHVIICCLGCAERGKQVISSYCQRTAKDVTSLRFITPEGSRINGNLTAEECGLEDDDVIDVFQDQVSRPIYWLTYTRLSPTCLRRGVLPPAAVMRRCCERGGFVSSLRPEPN